MDDFEAYQQVNDFTYKAPEEVKEELLNFETAIKVMFEEENFDREDIEKQFMRLKSDVQLSMIWVEDLTCKYFASTLPDSQT